MLHSQVFGRYQLVLLGIKRLGSSYSAGVLYLPWSHHRVHRMSLRSLRFRSRSRETSRMRDGACERLFPCCLPWRFYRKRSFVHLRNLLQNTSSRSISRAITWFWYVALCYITLELVLQCISINMLADKLNMTPDEAERWIVNLIRNAKLDAKIDSKMGHVMMGAQAVSPYAQVSLLSQCCLFFSV